MNALFWPRYILRSVRRSGRRASFALICIVIGVAGVVALQTAALTVQAALTSNVRAANGGDISVASREAPLSGADLGIFRRLQRAGKITSWTAVSSLHATSVDPSQRLVPFEVDVVSAPPYPIGGQPTFVTPASGNVERLLRGHGDVLLTSVLADELAAHVGSKVYVNSIGGRGLHGTVRGILAETNFEHSATLTVAHRDAAFLTTSRPHYTAVFANVSGSVDPVAQALRTKFPFATVQTVKDALQANEQQVHDFRQFVLLVGLLALLIAGVGILNSMQSILTWRRMEIAMLKAVGFREGSLYAIFGGEALLLGFLGGVGGTVLGAVVSRVITDTLARALAIQVNFQLDTGTLLGGVALGVAATLIFAILPIVRAASFRPLEILREGGSGGLTNRLPQTLGLLAVILVLFALLATITIGSMALALEFAAGAFLAFAFLTGAFAVAVGWVGRLGPSRSHLVGYGILFVLVVLTALSIRGEPALAALLVLFTLLWAAATLLSARRLLPLLIAVRSLSRRRTRTSVTLVAFLAGVLAMSVTLIVAVSLRSQINEALAANGTANLVAITTPSGTHNVIQAASRLPGIQNRTITLNVQTNPTAINGRPLASVIGTAATADPEQRDAGRLLGGVTGLDLHSGWGSLPPITLLSGRRLTPSDIGTAHAMARDDLQYSPFNLQLGDTVTLQESGTSVKRTIQIVGFYDRTRRQRGFGSFFLSPVLADRSLALALGGSDAQTTVAFTIDPSQLTHDATILQRAVPGALTINIGDLTAVVERILGELLNVLAVITALVLGAGLAVVGNGVAMAMLERRREVALFKAIGFGPRSVLSFVLVENALLGTLAGAVSVLTTAIALHLLSRFALSRAIGFDPGLAVLVLLIAAGLGLLTSYLVARSPIRIRPLEALRNE